MVRCAEMLLNTVTANYRFCLFWASSIAVEYIGHRHAHITAQNHPRWPSSFHTEDQKLPKFTSFSIISSLYVPISQQPLKIEPYKQRVYGTFLTVPVPPVETPWNLCPWKSYVECKWQVCVSSNDAVVYFYLYIFILVNFPFGFVW